MSDTTAKILCEISGNNLARGVLLDYRGSHRLDYYEAYRLVKGVFDCCGVDCDTECLTTDWDTVAAYINSMEAANV